MPEFSLRLPATSANLGPAFDTAAVAWNRFLQVRARPAAQHQIQARGRDAAVCGTLHDNLILATYADVVRRAGRTAPPLALEIDNEIPIGKGCGSSAAARLAGVALAVQFGRLGWDAQRILDEAAGREGHADNAAACWWGGLVTVQSGNNGAVRWLQIPAGTVWPMLIAVPPEPLATLQARAVLPDTYARADAVANVQHAVMLLQAWREGREDLLRDAMSDRLHEPYRCGLCPLLPVLQMLAGNDGILAVALSGAGPSILLVVRNTTTAAPVVQAALEQAGLQAELLAVEEAANGPGTSWRVA